GNFIAEIFFAGRTNFLPNMDVVHLSSSKKYFFKVRNDLYFSFKLSMFRGGLACQMRIFPVY
ncbi:TPA: hypothetical protein DCL22_02510, partial [Candidatus Moranbacteria bacterium]|nr:hypothetical protein [Candidatus Moranbacteria bacterium]